MHATHGKQGGNFLLDEDSEGGGPRLHRYLGRPGIKGDTEIGLLELAALALYKSMVRTEKKLNEDLDEKTLVRKDPLDSVLVDELATKLCALADTLFSEGLGRKGWTNTQVLQSKALRFLGIWGPHSTSYFHIHNMD
jgi:hypothetical protein